MALKKNTSTGYGRTNFVAEKKEENSLLCETRVDYPCPTSSLGDRVQHRLSTILSILLAIILTLSCLGGAELPCAAVRLSCPTLGSSAQLVNETSTLITEVFQVSTPALTVAVDGSLQLTDGSSNGSFAIEPIQRPTCQQVLLSHTFASSYGQPFVGKSIPPSCQYNRVTWNLTVLSAGRQFDRLGSVSLGDIEIFRTSTAEPTKNGIKWTYIKDVTNFLPLFKTEQTLIFDLGNLINDIYTASFNVTLSAAYFSVYSRDLAAPADLIVPISKAQGDKGQPNYFKTPDEPAVSNLTLPRNIKKAVATIAPTGQGLEEFWWGNVLQSEVDTIPNAGTLPGLLPFREVQLFIDGLLAGVVWPFPIIFTGGVVPGLWRPIVGIDAFDLNEAEVDISPWLPLLCDGPTLSGTTDTEWWISGKIFIWLDDPGHVTTGSPIQHHTREPSFQVSSKLSQSRSGSNQTLEYRVHAQRELFIESTIRASTGDATAYRRQDIALTNDGNFTAEGNIIITDQVTSGRDRSSSSYFRTYSYPIHSYSTQFHDADNLTLSATVERKKLVTTLVNAALPTGLESFNAINPNQSWNGAILSTSQNGTAYYTANRTEHTSLSFGTTEQDITLAAFKADTSPGVVAEFPKITQLKELFPRYVLASNGSVLRDEESLMIGEQRAVRHRHHHTNEAISLYNGGGAVLSGVPGRKEMFQ